MAAMIGTAYPTPVNIMSGFKKSGVRPINPHEATDRHTNPSTALCVQPQPQQTDLPTYGSASAQKEGPFSPEKEALYAKRFEEQYDYVDEPEYIA